MGQACRVLLFFVVAAVTAHAGLAVKWNTQPSPVPSAAPAYAPVQDGQVVAVHGRQVAVRMRDGSIRNYSATPQQARMLQSMLGAHIRFRVQGSPVR